MTPSPYFAKRTKTLIGAAALALLASCWLAFSVDGALAAGGGLSTTSESDGSSPDMTEPRGKEAKYKRIWKSKVSRKNKRWANRTSECESGRNPKAIGGGGKYRGAFQFLKTTWRASPKSPGGDPIRYSFKTQAVVAVALKTRDGARHWPVCGS